MRVVEAGRHWPKADVDRPTSEELFPILKRHSGYWNRRDTLQQALPLLDKNA
jgi:hypothetical protein